MGVAFGFRLDVGPIGAGELDLDIGMGERLIGVPFPESYASTITGDGERAAGVAGDEAIAGGGLAFVFLENRSYAAEGAESGFGIRQ